MPGTAEEGEKHFQYWDDSGSVAGKVFRGQKIMPASIIKEIEGNDLIETIMTV